MKKLILGALLVLSVFLIVACQAPVEEAADMPAEVVEEDVPEASEDAAEDMADDMAEDMPAMEDSEEMADAPVVVSEGDIIVYGPDGFNVEAYTVAVGAPVTFVNMHVGGKNVNDEISLTFQNPNNRRKFVTTDEFKYGEAVSVTFEEAGVWTGWAVEYGVELDITVTE